MTQRVRPAYDAWLYTFILQPHLEGAARLNFFFNPPSPVGWKGRLLYLISGCALMVPLIATIVWIFMQTFGHPRSLSDSYLAAIGNS